MSDKPHEQPDPGREFFLAFEAVTARYIEAWPEQNKGVIATRAAYTQKFGSPLGGATVEEVADSIQYYRDLELLNIPKTTVHPDPLATNVIANDVLPIFTTREIYAMRNATVEDMKRFPPVYLHIRRSNGERECSIFIVGNSNEYTREEIVSSNAEERIEALEKLNVLLYAVENSTQPEGLESGLVRSAYRAFATALWAWREAPEAKRERTATNIFSGPSPQQTDQVTRRLRQANSHREDYKLNLDGTALINQPTKNKRTNAREELAVILAPLVVEKGDIQIFPPDNIDEIKAMLFNAGVAFPVACDIAMELALAYDTVDLDLDHFIDRLGLKPHTTEKREEYRRMAWKYFKLLAQTSIVGKIKGKYRDRYGNYVDSIDKAPVLLIHLVSYDENARSPDGTIDNAKTPWRVVFGAGGFFAQNRGNRKILSSLGDNRQLSEISPAKPAGQWAQTSYTALRQHWRENAATCKIKQTTKTINKNGDEYQHVTVTIEKISRRELFALARPEPNPFKMLDSTDPKRAWDLWDAAIGILQERKLVKLVKPTIPKTTANPKGKGTETKPKRQGQARKDAWLDEALDLRPHPENRSVIEDIQAIADGAKAWNKKKSRRKKSDETTDEEPPQTTDDEPEEPPQA